VYHRSAATAKILSQNMLLNHVRRASAARDRLPTFWINENADARGPLPTKAKAATLGARPPERKLTALAAFGQL
jgi:hypothetical protein